MAGSDDPDVAEFLSSLKLGTHDVYRSGLKTFRQFYAVQGSVRGFLDRVEHDRLLPRRWEVARGC